MFQVHATARLRPSPFFNSVVAEGCTDASIYNRMILPASFGDKQKEYWDLLNGVVMWDVGAERQVQLEGPDAAKLAQILSPRDLSKCKIGQGKYVPLCNHDGILINDPILLKLREDLFWFSIADSDIWFWARAIAAERGWIELRLCDNNGSKCLPLLAHSANLRASWRIKCKSKLCAWAWISAGPLRMSFWSAAAPSFPPKS